MNAPATWYLARLFVCAQVCRPASTGARVCLLILCHTSPQQHSRGSRAAPSTAVAGTSQWHAGSELIYCVLSLSAKLYLGLFLLINVIMTDGTVEQSLAPAEGA